VSELQRSWESDSETVVAINEDNIVVLASNPDWLYRPVNDLDPTSRDLILESRQFGNETLKPLNWERYGDNRVAFGGTNYLLASRSSDWRNWTVHYLQPESIILRQTLLATAVFGSIITFLLGFATFLRSRRIEIAYTASERRRTELVEANQRLEEAQVELARSGKLAALGHLAASVTHELGQPISAFRNHLAAAEIGNEITSPKTAQNLNKLVDRMEAITRQFKFFARGREDKKTNVSLANVLQEVENLLKADIEAAEQALINLVNNAIHAVGNTDTPKITINIITKSDIVEIHVTDNGLGLANATLTDLQEPFFSTKPSGVGMGLGLAIATEIIKDHGGDLADHDYWHHSYYRRRS